MLQIFKLIHHITIYMEKKISVNSLLNFINRNIDTFKTLGCVDLNIVDLPNEETPTTICPLDFQDLKKLSYLPTNLANIFDLQSNKYLHAGMLKTNVATTFFSSILTCLKQSFLSQNVAHQSKFIKRFIEILSAESKGILYSKFEYKQFGWGRDDISNCLMNLEKENDVGANIIKYVSDYLHINIFVMDIANDLLRYGGGETYVPYKKTILVLKHTDENNKCVYEPVFTERSPQCFKIDDKIIGLIRNPENISKIIPYTIGKSKKNTVPLKFTEITEDLNQYLLNPVSTIAENVDVKKTTADISEKERLDKQAKPEIHEIKANATLSDLKKIATELGIPLDNELRAKTKAVLIKEIRAYYSKKQ